MDWTIVLSVLVALLLVPVVMALLGGLVFLIGATVLRGRIQRLLEQKVAHCMQMFSSREPATGAACPAAPGPCPCAEPSEER